MKYILEMANFRKLEKEQKEIIDKEVNTAFKNKTYKDLINMGLYRSETPRQWSGRTFSLTSDKIKEHESTFFSGDRKHSYLYLTYVFKPAYEDGEYKYRVHVTSSVGFRQLNPNKYIFNNLEDALSDVKRNYSNISKKYDEINEYFFSELKNAKTIYDLESLFKKYDRYTIQKDPKLKTNIAGKDLLYTFLKDKKVEKIITDIIIKDIDKDPSMYFKYNDIFKNLKSNNNIIKKIDDKYKHLGKDYDFFN